LKEDILKVYFEFHASGKFERNLNATFLTLIPKTPGAVNPKDSRPISLVGSIYKMIAKILANRLKIVLERIISKSQNAFLQVRQILDPILITNECLDNIFRSGELVVICKMDLTKVYDHVNWDFQLYMLRKCGFRGKWCSCLDSSLYFLSVDFGFGEWLFYRLL
jgi:hypothetical protein